MAPVHRTLGILDDEKITDFGYGVLALLSGTRLKSIYVSSLLKVQADAIGARTTKVLLSSYTALKIWLKHAKTSFTPSFDAPGLFLVLPRAIHDGECRKIGPNKLAFLWSDRRETSRPYKVVVKATKDRRLFIEAIYRIQPTQVKQTVAKSSPVKSRMRKPRARPPRNPA